MGRGEKGSFDQYIKLDKILSRTASQIIQRADYNVIGCNNNKPNIDKKKNLTTEEGALKRFLIEPKLS